MTNQTVARREAARDRAARLGVRLHVVKPRRHYWSPSQSQDDTVYQVRLLGDDWVCDCPGFQFSGGTCKHIGAVELRAEAEGWAEPMQPGSDEANAKFAALFGGK